MTIPKVEERSHVSLGSTSKPIERELSVAPDSLAESVHDPEFTLRLMISRPSGPPIQLGCPRPVLGNTFATEIARR
jgi:hypothetical protein